jgi:ribosomal protein S18 acetylase RimI-like enzyme
MSQDVQPAITIRPAKFPEDLEVVQQLFLAYERFLPVKLDFQNFDQEVAQLPGKYALENKGALYLASKSDTPTLSSQTSQMNGATVQPTPTQTKEHVVGIVGLRCLSTSSSIPTCELKRLYLTPESRGLGVSKLLLDVVLAQARQLGYKEMVLDTLSSMTTPRRLYEKYGFVEIASYYQSVDDAVFYKLVL